MLKVDDKHVEKLLGNFGRNEHRHLSESQIINWIKNHLNDEDYGKHKFNQFLAASYYAGIEPKIVLDLACGSGSFAFNSIKFGNVVIGIDISKDLIEIASLKYKYYLRGGKLRNDKGLFVVGSGLEIPLKNNSIDSICSFQAIEHIENVERYLSECVRVLKVGGYIFITAPDYYTFHEGHYQIAWFPMLPKKIAELYLYLRGKDPNRIKSIYFVTNGTIKRKLKKIKGIELSDIRYKHFEELYKRKLSNIKSKSSFSLIIAKMLLKNELIKIILKNIFLLSQRKIMLLIVKRG